MFSSSSRFRELSCPLEEECVAPNCIFKHNGSAVQQKVPPTVLDYDDLDCSPPRKRLKQTVVPPLPLPLPSSPPPPPPPRAKPAKPFTGALLQKQADKDPQVTKTEERDISPPPARRQVATAHLQKKVESLNPRMLKAPPAGHATRLLYLKKLHEAMSELNDRLLEEGHTDHKHLHMTPNEVILLALDEEERMARDSPAVYANVIKMSMVEHKKMPLAAWVARRQTHTLPRANERPSNTLDTGLSGEQEILLLPYLLAQQNGLEKFGYITSIPSEKAIMEARAAVAICDYWEKCERCGSRFQVFPDRREDGALTSGGECSHHPLRPMQPQRDPSAKGPSSKVYPCCNEPLGMSLGCETTSSHVYKFGDSSRLASVLQFESTPDNAEIPTNRAVSFDCEMGWTTKGMELIRITAVSWPKGDLLLDVLVKPLGQILDLNSRFSGVQPEQFAKALPHESSLMPILEEGQGHLKIVDSPQTARRLLFDLISPSTPLIGHAIENDLIAMRIVHPCIIDTVLLYPIRAGLPIRRSLKAAAKELLGRSIQGGGAAGHDSMEDARATGDLVRLKVKGKWADLRRQGWAVKGAALVPPATGGEYQGPLLISTRIEEHVKRQQLATGVDIDYGHGDKTDSPGR